MTTNAYLIPVAGPLEKTTISLLEDEVSVGRDSSNSISIRDYSVSRRHCVIKRDSESFKILDLESANGTFVNDLPAGEQLLKHGDQIGIGRALFLFQFVEGEHDGTHSSVELSDDELNRPATTQLPSKDAVYLKPDAVKAALGNGGRIARDLNALLKISTMLSTVRQLAQLETTLLQTLLETIPADRGAILRVHENSEEVVASYGTDKIPRPQQPIRISRSVVQKVMRKGVAILCVDVRDDQSLGDAESLFAAQVHSLLCVPLIIRDRVAGLIYLDTSNRGIVLDEGHLQLVTAVGSIAAVAIENVQHLEWLQGENQRLHQQVNLEHNMIGESPRMRDVYRFIERVAPASTTVLIRGESGTGKELVAHAIHSNSDRSAKQFVAINCAVLSEPLLESELFGHEKGAFTGAVAQKRGRLEVADGGTLFLDEVGELAPATQAKLLRVLQERQFERLGSTRSINVDVRIIAATNRNLEEAIKSGRFRDDLYYRLNVISLTLPPLRERRDDIPLLAYYFIEKYSKKCKRLVNGISPEARACLVAYDWPGNVRELENTIERAIVLGNTEVIVPEDLPESLLTGSAPQKLPDYHEAVNEMKKKIIQGAIEQAGGNYTQAAKLLGIHSTNLHRLIRTLGLRASTQKIP